MSHSEAPWSYTVKFEGNLLSCRGNDLGHFIQELGKASAIPEFKTLHDVLLGQAVPATTEQAIANVQQAVPQATVVYDQAPPPQPQFAPVAPPQAAPAQYAAAAAPQCEHGMARKRIEPGVSKTTGKPYSGFWACQMPRGEQCKPVSF